VAGNSSLASTRLSISSDRTVPSLTISPNNLTVAPGDVTFTFQFSEAVSGFSGSSVNISSGSKGTFTAVDADTYTLLVTPDGVNPVAVSVAADVAEDAAGNLNASVSADVAFAGFLVTQSGGSTAVKENGSTDTVSVVLTSRPQTNVVLMVSSEDTSEVSVNSTLLMFSLQNWNTPQIVTVTGEDDQEADGTQNTVITVSVLDSSSDDAFDLLADQGFTVSTSDNEVITVSLDQDGNLRIADSSTAGLAENLTLVFLSDVLLIFDSTNVLFPEFGTYVSDHQVQVALAAITGQRIIADLRNGNDRLNADGVPDPFALDVSAGPGNDTITGGSGSDTIDGGAGDDSILAGAGDDLVSGGAGSNDLTGGSGTDTLLVTGNTYLWISDTDAAGSGRDVHSGFERAILEGSAGNNRLDASQATLPVTLLGGAGNDTLLGGGGADELNGGDGIDYAEIMGSNIVLTNDSAPGADGDSLVLVEGLQLIATGPGSQIDASSYTSGPVTIIGSSGNDTLKGGSGNDLILAGSGSDQVNGGAGNDFISGGSGADVLSGDGGDDTIFGGSGRDVIDGGDNADLLLGGSGRDSIDGVDGADTLYGGGGADNLAGGIGNDSLNGLPRDDSFNDVVGRDTIIGGNRPEGRPAPVSVLGQPAIEAEVPLFQSPRLYSEETEEIDQVFLDPLLPELLEL
jgi:Ca2+-binding RTX toxin-like protein